MALLLAVAGAGLKSRWASDMWFVRSDHVPLALGHALNMELAAQGVRPRPVLYYQYYHPGLPLQVTSWLALRLAGLGHAEHADPFASALAVLQDPTMFWRVSGLLASLLTIAALLVLGTGAKDLSATAMLAVCASYFCLDSSWTCGFMLLANDTFAPLLAALLFLLARRAFAADRPPLGTFAVAGAVAAVAYLCKLPYITWTVAFFAGLALRTWTEIATRRAAWIFGGLAFSAAWLGTFAAVTWALMTPEAVRSMLEAHFGIAQHSGYHGTGGDTVVNSAMVSFALGNLLDHPLFLLTLGLLALATVGSLRARGRAQLPREWPFVMMFAVALLLALAAVIKHYKVYYLLVGLAVVPVAFAWCLEAMDARLRRALCAALLALCAASFGLQLRRPPLDLNHWSVFVPWQGLPEEIAAIERLPLDPGEVRLWTYGCVGPSYYRIFASQISDYPSLMARVGSEFPLERPVGGAARQWRYVIFEQNLLGPAGDNSGAEPLRRQYQAALAQGDALPGFLRYVVIEHRRQP